MTKKRKSWQQIVVDIMNAKPPKGAERYTYAMIEKETGIKVFTLCRVFTGSQTKIYYDDGVALMALHKKVHKK